MDGWHSWRLIDVGSFKNVNLGYKDVRVLQPAEEA